MLVCSETVKLLLCSVKLCIGGLRQNCCFVSDFLSLSYSGRTSGCLLWTRSCEECILCDVIDDVVADTLNGLQR